MADEILDETPSDDIGSALAAAFAEHEANASQAAETKPVAAKPAAQAASEQTDAATDATQEDSASAAEAGKSEETAGASDEKTSAAEKAATGTEPPANWSAKDKELFKKQPPEVQEFMSRRHKEMEGDYVKKTQAIANFRREYEPVDKIFEPYRERMKAGGWTPAKLVEAWGNVERRLMEGDGVNVVAGLVKGYGINLGQVAQALGLRPRPQPNGQANGDATNGAPQPTQPQRGIDDISLSPDHPVMRQLAAISARFDADDRARADEARRLATGAETRVMNQIEEFKSALDDKGQLLHPHFDEVEDMMTRLAQSALAAKQPVPPLKELYETAVRANPSTHEAWLAARDRAQQEKAASEARAKAAQAKRAGSSVTGAPGPGQAPRVMKQGNRSLTEDIEAAWAEHAGSI